MTHPWTGSSRGHGEPHHTHRINNLPIRNSSTFPPVTGLSQMVSGADFVEHVREAVCRWDCWGLCRCDHWGLCPRCRWGLWSLLRILAVRAVQDCRCWWVRKKSFCQFVLTLFFSCPVCTNRKGKNYFWKTKKNLLFNNSLFFKLFTRPQKRNYNIKTLEQTNFGGEFSDLGERHNKNRAWLSNWPRDLARCRRHFRGFKLNGLAPLLRRRWETCQK